MLPCGLYHLVSVHVNDTYIVVIAYVTVWAYHLIRVQYNNDKISGQASQASLTTSIGLNRCRPTIAGWKPVCLGRLSYQLPG